MILYGFFFIITLIFIFYISFFILNYKIKILEKEINKNYNNRANFIPILYDVSRNSIAKHDEIFSKIIKLHEKNFFQNKFQNNLSNVIDIHTYIFNEINFIFKVCSMQKKLHTGWKYIYIKKLISKQNEAIAKKIDIYKKVVKQYNTLIQVKNKILIGIFIPFQERYEI